MEFSQHCGAHTSFADFIELHDGKSLVFAVNAYQNRKGAPLYDPYIRMEYGSRILVCDSETKQLVVLSDTDEFTKRYGVRWKCDRRKHPVLFHKEKCAHCHSQNLTFIRHAQTGDNPEIERTYPWYGKVQFRVIYGTLSHCNHCDKVTLMDGKTGELFPFKSSQ